MANPPRTPEVLLNQGPSFVPLEAPTPPSPLEVAAETDESAVADTPGDRPSFRQLATAALARLRRKPKPDDEEDDETEDKEERETPPKRPRFRVPGGRRTRVAMAVGLSLALLGTALVAPSLRAKKTPDELAKNDEPAEAPTSEAPAISEPPERPRPQPVAAIPPRRTQAEPTSTSPPEPDEVLSLPEDTGSQSVAQSARDDGPELPEDVNTRRRERSQPIQLASNREADTAPPELPDLTASTPKPAASSDEPPPLTEPVPLVDPAPEPPPVPAPEPRRDPPLRQDPAPDLPKNSGSTAPRVANIPELATPPAPAAATTPPTFGDDPNLVAVPNARKRRVAAPATLAMASSADAPARASLTAADPAEPILHTVRSGENFYTIAEYYYGSGRYWKALWSANSQVVPTPEQLTVGMTIKVPMPDTLDPTLVGVSRSRDLDGSVDTSRTTRRPSPSETTTSAEERPVIRSTPRSGGAGGTNPRTPITPSRFDNESTTARRVGLPVHTVERNNETLRSIARDRLGDPSRAREVHDLNYDRLGDDPVLRPGMAIRLPEDARDRR